MNYFMNSEQIEIPNLLVEKGMLRTTGLVRLTQKINFSGENSLSEIDIDKIQDNHFQSSDRNELRHPSKLLWEL